MGHKRVLLTEGKDERFVIQRLLEAHGVQDLPFECNDKIQGAEHLLRSLPVQLKGSDLERLAVVLDADENIERRWAQLHGCFRKAGSSPLPEKPNPKGTIVSISDKLKFGVWLMPNNRLPGMLEDFLAYLVPDEDLMLPRVDAFLKDIPAEIRLFPESRLPKARIHAWLAVQEEPGKPLGQSILARYLQADCPDAQTFVHWLRKILVD